MKSQEIGNNNGAENGSVDHGNWDLARIVGELRTARVRSRQGCIDKGDREMPSRDALHGIIEGLFGVLFPDQFGLPDLTEEGIDYFVGHRLDETLRALSIRYSANCSFPATRPKTTP